MGIPSYYKKLCDRTPGLLSKVRKGAAPTHLWIDFNCMVYHCLRRPGATPYGGEETRLEWENHLISEVCKYLKKIVALVAPTEQVFVGVDGVVPMAKMRQQRLRRFKSHWTASEEQRIGKSDGGPRWDTNAITPGTSFMERLGVALKECKSPKLKWTVSTADEPGEGEHKVMNGIRSCADKNSHVVYGLDADLIVLSLLQPVKEMWLFREAVECGEVQYKDNEEEYRYFSIHRLREVLCEGKDKDYLLDYCMALSFVGNDFLPHGLSLKLKDGGHDVLLKMLADVRKSVGPLIESNSWRLESLKACLDWLASHEDYWVQTHCSAKVGRRYQPPRGSNEKERAIDEWNKLPLRICEEMAITKSFEKSEDGRLSVVLREDWRDVYRDRWLGCSNERVSNEYLVGLDWILQYYIGNSVNTEWCYPWFLPPLWEDLRAYTNSLQTLPKAPEPIAVEYLVKPQEQLALVLPIASWWLIRDPKLRRLPRISPHLWPSKFELFTAGRSQVWECEAQIPLFLPSRLRYLLSHGN